ncbi:MAG: hypothetical protein FIB01_04240 [Gemmatimonadetes bacterium]|nr:hypothetical protein [Gemmatimonadota bacterium]
MEGIGLLLFILMIIVSVIEQANKAKQKPGQRPPSRVPPGRRPGAELPPARPGSSAPGSPRSESGPVTMSGQQAESERSAADMVAEDFWRELTGLPPRPRPGPQPAPSSQMPAEASSWDEQAVSQVEAPPPETAPRRVSKSWEYRRPETVHEPPVVVSLEEPVQPAAVRRAEFQRKLAAQAAEPAPVAASSVAAAPLTGATAAPLRQRLRQGQGLRESVIMAEVFGRPRGLEEYSPDR